MCPQYPKTMTRSGARSNGFAAAPRRRVDHGLNHGVTRWIGFAVHAARGEWMTTKWFGACAALSTVVFGTALGQQKGQYVLGTNGLNAGIMPPPGFTYANQST